MSAPSKKRMIRPVLTGVAVALLVIMLTGTWRMRILGSRHTRWMRYSALAEEIVSHYLAHGKLPANQQAFKETVERNSDCREILSEYPCLFIASDKTCFALFSAGHNGKFKRPKNEMAQAVTEWMNAFQPVLDDALTSSKLASGLQGASQSKDRIWFNLRISPDQSSSLRTFLEPDDYLAIYCVQPLGIIWQCNFSVYAEFVRDYY